MSELVAPVWCEYQHLYSLLGQAHLPPSQRPTSIVTPSGATVQLDVKQAKDREDILEKGRTVHEKLEKEIHPGERIYVRTKSKEDDWALRMLKFVTGVKALLEGGCCRELNVFGILHGRLVLGVIDEIDRRTLTLPHVDGTPGKMAGAAAANGANLTKDEHGNVVVARQGPTKVPEEPNGPPESPSLNVAPTGRLRPEVSSRTPTKGGGSVQYESQEEWKKAKAKEEREKKAAAKLSTASKSKGSAAKSPKGKKKEEQEPGGKNLFSFFPSSASERANGSATKVTDIPSKVASQSDPAHDTTEPSAAVEGQDDGTLAPAEDVAIPLPESQQKTLSQGFAYFVSDSKTRYARSIPWASDQTGSRMQCMIYKRLLDGLIIGSKLVSKDAAGYQAPATMACDPLAHPITLTTLSDDLKLDVTSALSDAFLADAIPLCDSYGFDLISHTANDSGPCTLQSIFALMRDTIAELCESAKLGYDQALQTAGYSPSSQASSAQISPVIADELSLVYRQRSQNMGRGAKRSKTNHAPASKRRKQAAKEIARESYEIVAGIVADQESKDAPETSTKPAQDACDQAKSAPPIEGDDDVEISAALQVALAVETEREKLEGQSLPANQSPARSQEKPAPASSPATPISKDEGSIIGKVHFVHESDKLEAYLVDVFQMWEGQRELVGVSEQELSRCQRCEYIEGCEWRDKKQEEFLVRSREQKLALEQRKKEAAAKIAEIREAEAVFLAMEQEQSGDAQESLMDSNGANVVVDENVLWSQFDDMDDVDWDMAESDAQRGK